jgi:hypothetical protein
VAGLDRVLGPVRTCEFTLGIIHEFGNILEYFVTFIQGAGLTILQCPLERKYSLSQASGQTIIVPPCVKSAQANFEHFVYIN